MDPVVGWWH